MRRSAVAEHDGFDQRRPSKVVDVIERRSRFNQDLHHLGVAQVRGGDQRRALVGAGDVPRVRAQRQRQPERRRIVGHGGNGDDIVVVVFEGVGIGARVDQDPHHLVPAEICGYVQRRAAVAIANVDRRAARDRLFHPGHVPHDRSLVKSTVSAALGSARRCLRHRGDRCRKGHQRDAHD